MSQPPLSDGRRCVYVVHVFEKNADSNAYCQCGSWSKAALQAPRHATEASR